MKKDFEFEKIDKEIKEYNKIKEDIKSKISFHDPKNFDTDSIIFKIFGVEDKKNKKAVVSFLHGNEERVFLSTFNKMNDYYKEIIKKDYVKIEEISFVKEIFLKIKDRIKSNKNYLEEQRKKLEKYNKIKMKADDFDKITNNYSEINRTEREIRYTEYRITQLEDIATELKRDFKK